MGAWQPAPPTYPAEPPLGPVARPPDAWSRPHTATPTATQTSHAWAAVVVAGIGVVIGAFTAFAPWAEYVDGVELTGVEHGDGWFVLAIVAAAGGLVGTLAAGWRHPAVRFGLIGASVALSVLFLLNRIDISRSEDRVTGGPIDVGGGLYGVVVAACLLLAGALIIPARSSAPPRA
ncbi:MAG TPA: hypothetical protein VF183_11465 [Acidimicrobiales bacterium]